MSVSKTTPAQVLDQPQGPLLEVRNLKKHFPIKGGLLRRQVGAVKAVDGISFSLQHGETLGLVGESGCGKTTTGRAILRLIEPTSGEIIFNGDDVMQARRGKMRDMRRDMQIVFQDPFASLNPRVAVGESIAEGLRIHGVGNAKERREQVVAVLDRVGMNSSHLRRYPHEFSGGQRQRIGIARALVMRPKLIVCDEPVSALDVSIQAQVLNLLKDLQQEFGLTYLFIAHNLGVVEHISNRVGVMYLGRMVELATRNDLFHEPLHPYTKALMSAIPLIPVQDQKAQKQERIILEGDVPSPVNPPSGCHFHPRCWMAEEICQTADPVFEEKRPDHFVACHLVSKQ